MAGLQRLLYNARHNKQINGNRGVPRLSVTHNCSMAITLYRQGEVCMLVDLLNAQRLVCERYKALYYGVNQEHMLGIAADVQTGKYPLNGLRSPATNDTSGWYIWSGEHLSQADDYFVPMHVKHTLDLYPEILSFLGLPLDGASSLHKVMRMFGTIPHCFLMFSRSAELLLGITQDIWIENSGAATKPRNRMINRCKELLASL